jgi:hypothetical protein
MGIWFFHAAALGAFIVLSSLRLSQEMKRSDPAVDNIVVQNDGDPSFRVPMTCPVTRAFDQHFIPPFPYSSQPAPGRGWFGTDRLWVMAPASVWTGISTSRDEPVFRNKIAWWRQGYDWRSQPKPRLRIRGRRLDRSAKPLSATVSNAGATLPYMMSLIEVPTFGCWEITGQYDDDTLTFVVWVAPGTRQTANLQTPVD